MMFLLSSTPNFFYCLRSSAQLYADIDLSPEAKKLLSENKGARTEMLEDSTPGREGLCEKKDLIINKFNTLLRKLGGEELSLNISQVPNPTHT